MRTTTIISLIIFILAGCSKSQQPLSIGFTAPLSGRLVDLGYSGRNGAQLAVEHQNQQGGVHGSQIKLQSFDNQLDKQRLHEIVSSFAASGGQVIIGPFTSTMAQAATQVANQQQLLLVSPTAMTTYLQSKDDFFVRVVPSTSGHAAEMAQYLISQKELSDVTVILDNGNAAYTESWLSGFKQTYEKLGGTIINKITFSHGAETNYQQLAHQLLEKKAKVILMIASAYDVAMLSQQIRKFNPTVQLASAGWASTSKLLEMGGIAVEGLIISPLYDSDNKTPEYRQFADQFQQRFSEQPDFAAVYAYEATKLTLHSIIKQQEDESLKETIIRLGQFTGLQGPFSINQFGDADRRIFISKVKEGGYSVIND
jgi:branched-chain amino acid transport system substrate-binding protein